MLAITMKILTEKVGKIFDKLWFMAELIQNIAISTVVSFENENFSLK